ncbi:MAG: phosphatase PAP2 family protein, partial [Oscillospiraceae bacterium]
MEIIQEIDFSILEFLQSLHNDVLNSIMHFFTFLGDKGFIWIVMALFLLFIPQTRRMGAYLAVTLVVLTLVNEVGIKSIFQRSRPFIQQPLLIDTVIPHPGGYSFPSSHSASSFASATTIYKFNKPIGIAAYIVAGFIALSRIYFGVHFPTDILAGAAVGIITALIINKLLNLLT